MSTWTSSTRFASATGLSLGILLMQHTNRFLPLILSCLHVQRSSFNVIFAKFNGIRYQCQQALQLQWVSYELMFVNILTKKTNTFSLSACKVRVGSRSTTGLYMTSVIRNPIRKFRVEKLKVKNFCSSILTAYCTNDLKYVL